MRKHLLTGLIALCAVSLSSCKKKEETKSNECQQRSMIIGKWTFVSKKVTDYKTGAPSTPSSNNTVNFDAASYIEFKSDNTYRWYEVYQGKVYEDRNNVTDCWSDGTFLIYLDKSKGQTIPESIKELTNNKLVFTYNILRCGSCGDYSQTVVIELKK
ncbi:hypothetical protein [Pedobacter alluvionis]|uniref:Lipocalin-like domain-containing protein n=1 Tax=Pedobacter alluvionis TaxID=475253 RepID=A0A497XML9_9SPHI|nr:hypothetical protein [Pedobacter alluvionis]RLJ69313.1 hypothetical protein BCL90_5235 [Pedobacter alluvionis]TFB30309.1 hypothetical protein E3V97_19270 [Pedobacter alluvionis]